MYQGHGYFAALGATLLLQAALAGCSANAQRAPVAEAPVAVATTPSAMPEPRAPFEETPITPMESVGAPAAR